MCSILEEENDFIDSLLEESSLFVKFYLGENVHLHDLFHEVIGGLPAIDHFDLEQKSAVFFRELEKVSRAQKKQISHSHKSQLELFPELPDQASLLGGVSKEIGICRTRAFISYWNRSGKPLAKDVTLPGNEKGLEQVLQLSAKLLLEQFFEDGTTQTMEDLDRYQSIARYLMELLPDPESVEVEKKCRQDPEWQRDKVWISKIMGWFEIALQSPEKEEYPPVVLLDSEIKSLLLAKFSHSSSNPPPEESSSDVPVEEKPVDQTPKYRGDRDVCARVYWVVGLVALLIGYFGWVERGQKIEESVGTEDKTVDPLDLTMEGDAEDFARLALVSAEKSASSALAEQTVAVIKKMEKGMEVPNPLLLQLPVEETDVILTKPDPISDPFLAQEPAIMNKDLETALAMGTGYLFRPGKESLGRIIEARYVEEKLFFKRADWPNPEASFGLSVSDYEIRMGTPERGFLILGGEVRRQVDEIEGNSSVPIHYLIPTRAWWLDRNQSRTPVGLNLLQNQ